MTDRVTFPHADFIQQTKIDTHNAANSVADNASHYAFYNSQMGLWQLQQAHYKILLSVEESQARLRIQKEEGKLTAVIGDAKVAVDPEVVKLKKLLAVAEQQFTLYTHALKAFLDRGNNARSINTTQRSEQTMRGSMPTVTDVYLSKEDGREALRKIASKA